VIVISINLMVQQRRRLLREGLSTMLAACDGIEVSQMVAEPTELLWACTSDAPDVVVMDLAPSTDDALVVAATLQRRFPTIRLVGWYGASEPPTRRPEALDAIVTLHGGAEALVDAIRAVHQPTTEIDLRDVDRTTRRSVLTPREAEVLGLVASGWTSREVGAQLTISAKTVENHKQRIFAKLNVQNQAHAVAVAVRGGYLRLDRARERPPA
jgi:DNA-binding NarL/FixJ family response regulator